MKNYRKIGAVLMAILALALLPAAALATTSSHQIAAHHGGILEWVLGVGLAMGGTVVVTYSSFIADQPAPQFGTAYTGGTTPPSAQQSGQVNRINALVGFTDADTSITLTHNWGLSAAAHAAFEPDIIISSFALGSETTTGGGGYITWARNTNTVVGTKASATGSGGTICVTLRLPATPGN